MRGARIYGILLSLVLLTALVLTSCATKPAPKPSPTPTSSPSPTAKPSPTPTATTAPSPTPTQTPVPITTPAPAIQFQKKTWQYANILSQNFESWDGRTAKFAEELSKLTGGAITITPRHAGALLGAKDVLPGVAGGLSPLGYMNGADYPAIFPEMILGGILDPVISAKHDILHFGYLNEILLNEFGTRPAQMAGVKILMGGGSNERSLFTKKKITRLDDLKGMKLRSSGGKYYATFYQAMGAVAVDMPMGDYADAVQKGLVEGCLSTVASFWQDKMLDATPYFLWVPGQEFFTVNLFPKYTVIMSTPVWTSLNDEEKRAVLKAAKAGSTNYITKFNDVYVQALKDLRSNPKNVFTTLPAEDLKRIMENPLVANQIKDIAADVNKAGGKGDALVKRWQELIDKSDAELEKLWEQMWADRIANLW